MWAVGYPLESHACGMMLFWTFCQSCSVCRGIGTSPSKYITSSLTECTTVFLTVLYAFISLAMTCWTGLIPRFVLQPLGSTNRPLNSRMMYFAVSRISLSVLSRYWRVISSILSSYLSWSTMIWLSSEELFNKFCRLTKYLTSESPGLLEWRTIVVPYRSSANFFNWLSMSTCTFP